MFSVTVMKRLFEKLEYMVQTSRNQITLHLFLQDLEFFIEKCQASLIPSFKSLYQQAL